MAKGKAVAKQEKENGNNELVSMERNYFETYGSQMAVGTTITGQLLKFSKGDWLAGQEDEEMEVGTKLVANMDSLTVGWVKWVDNKPVEQLMGLLIDGFQPKRRGELGDTDESEWEVGTDGKARDPWQFTNYLVMKTPGKRATDDDELYTFATSSRGGLNAIGSLCKFYGKETRVKPNDFPIVVLNVDSYMHPNKEFGRIKIPSFSMEDSVNSPFKAAGWETKKLFASK